MDRHSRQKGFSLLELLIVVVVIGLLASIAIPGLMNGLHRGRQKRTMSDLRTIATALDAYAVDHGHYPSGEGTAALLIQPLSTHFMRLVPTTDGWDHVIRYAKLDPVDTGEDYILWSLGRDGIDDGNDGTDGETNDLDSDIVIFNGRFTQWPAGIQR